MNKTIKSMGLALTMTSLMATCAIASPAPASADAPAVRVNGELVNFTDGSPYVDENSRTMIPIRSVAEELDAEVIWDDLANTVTITKAPAKVSIKIGNSNLVVTEDGKKETIKMDTAAVTKNGRTYVPVRYVAEALGAAVDYSEKAYTVGIYDDVLTKSQIEKLRSYPYTTPAYALSCADARARYDESYISFLYGDRTGFSNFANAREHLYQTMDRTGTYNFYALQKTLKNSDTDTYFKWVVDEAIAGINYESERMRITFHADESCLYQPDGMDRTTGTVRGVAEVNLYVDPIELEGEETTQLCNLGFTQLYKGTPMYMDVDAHMNIQPNYNVNIHTIVPLGEAY